MLRAIQRYDEHIFINLETVCLTDIMNHVNILMQIDDDEDDYEPALDDKSDVSDDEDRNLFENAKKLLKNSKYYGMDTFHF